MNKDKRSEHNNQKLKERHFYKRRRNRADQLKNSLSKNYKMIKEYNNKSYNVIKIM